MMRLILLLCLVMTFSSCSGSEPESRLPVTAAAFDRVNRQSILTLEVMVSASGGSQASMTPTCFVGTGDSFSEAMADAAQSVGRDINFDHMALAILGDGLAGSDLKDAITFCSSIDGVTPALEFVSAEDAGSILTGGANNGSALAYEITAALDSKASEAYTDGCRLADVMDRRLLEKIWAIPRLALEDEGKDSQQVKRVGMAVYDRDYQLDLLKGELSLVWRMLADYSIQGNVRFGEEIYEITDAALDGDDLTLSIKSGDPDRAEELIEAALAELFNAYPELIAATLGEIDYEEIDAEVTASIW